MGCCNVTELDGCGGGQGPGFINARLFEVHKYDRVVGVGGHAGGDRLMEMHSFNRVV